MKWSEIYCFMLLFVVFVVLVAADVDVALTVVEIHEYDLAVVVVGCADRLRK